MIADTIEFRHRGMRVGKNLTLALLLPSDARRSNDCDSCAALLSARRALREARSLVLALFDTSCCGIACTEGPICEHDAFDQHHARPHLHPYAPTLDNLAPPPRLSPAKIEGSLFPSRCPA